MKVELRRYSSKHEQTSGSFNFPCIVFIGLELNNLALACTLRQSILQLIESKQSEAA